MSLSVPFRGIQIKIRKWVPGDDVVTGGLIAIDTETHLIDFDRPAEYPDAVVLTAYGGRGVVDMVGWRDIPEYQSLLLEKNPTAVFVFHNAPFDIGVLGIEPWIAIVDQERVWDTGLQWVLRRLASTGLGDTAREYPSLARVVRDLTGEVLEKDGDVRLTFRREIEPDDAHAVYACKDAIVTWQASVLMGPQPTMGTQVKGFLMLDSVRRNGLMVDKKTTMALRAKYIKQMNKEKEVLLGWGIRLDKPRTPGEMLEYIGDWIGWPPVKDKPEERVWRLKWALSLALREERAPTEEELDEAWTPNKEREVKAALGEETPLLHGLPKIADMSKRQVTELLFRVAASLKGDDKAAEGLVDAWHANEGWPGGYKEKGSDTRLQELLEEAEAVHRISFERTETGRIATSSEALDEVPDEDLRKLPFLDSWKRYKHAEKLCSTFLNPAMIGKDGRIHPRPVPILATGRTSMSGPNSQNISKEPGIREQYTAPPGFVLVSCDYSQQELVALAQTCYTRFGYSRLRDLINHDIDAHGYMGATIAREFQHLPEFTTEDGEVLAAYQEALAAFKRTQPVRYAELRQLSKAANFGYPGGLGARRFVTYARGYGVNIGERESQELKDLWLVTFPEMEQHLQPEPMNDSRYPDRYKATTLTGRLRVNCSFCAAANTLFQGLAADCSKEAGWRLLKEGYVLNNFVHDEYIAAIPYNRTLTARAEYMRQIMVEEMRRLTPDVKVKAEAVAMYRWSKAAEPWYDGEGDLTPWEFVPKDSKNRLPVPWESLSTERQTALLEKKYRVWDMCLKARRESHEQQ